MSLVSIQTNAQTISSPAPSSPTLPQAARTPTPQPTPPSEPTPPQDDARPPQTRSELFTFTGARPVPPLPQLERLGITSGANTTLSLNDAIRRALISNNEIEVARTDVRLAETSLQAFEGVYQPVFAITPQISNIGSPQRNIFQGSEAVPQDATSSTTFSLAPSVTKQFSRGGGRYDFSFDSSRTRTKAGSLQGQFVDTSFNSGFGLGVTQPLLRDRSIDSFRRNIRIQRRRLEQSDADFRRRVIEVIAQVQNAYWELVFALRDQQNRVANLNLARENFRLTEARVAAGSLAPLARAEIQTELSTRESDLLVAAQNVSLAENNLKQLMLKDATSPEWSTAITPTDEPRFDTTPISLETSLTDARTNRPELRRLRVERDINDIDQKFFRNQTKPRIDLQANISTNGFINSVTQIPNPNLPNSFTLIPNSPTTNGNAFLLQQLNQIRNDINRINNLQGNTALLPITSPDVAVSNQTITSNNGGFGSSLRNIFNFDNRNIIVGLRIELPFRNQTAQANLAGSRIAREQLDAQTRLQEQVVETEVRNAAQRLETARRRVLAARTAREAAELQLQGERTLFDAGRSTQFLLFQRENALANARNQELRAETDYSQALANLQRATSTTLQVNNVTVDTPN